MQLRLEGDRRAFILKLDFASLLQLHLCVSFAELSIHRDYQNNDFYSRNIRLETVRWESTKVVLAATRIHAHIAVFWHM